MENRSALLKLPLLLLLLLLLQVYGTDAKLNIITTTQDVRVGEQILMLCKAGAEGDITWQKDGEDIDDEEKVSKPDESTTILTIEKATLEDAGKYTCTCEYESNGRSEQTEILIYVYEGPSFRDTKTYHELLEGTNGMVPCVGTGKPEVEIHWFRDNKSIPSTEGEHVRQVSDNTLLFEKVKREDHGLYVCRAQIKGRSIFKDLQVSVVVSVPPKVKPSEEVKKAIAGSENSVSLVCSADGHPKPNITWTMPVPFDPSHHQYNSDHSELIIHSVNRADYGEYVCTATNKISEDSATIMLDVFEVPEVFVSAEKLNVSLGECVSVSCNVSGHPQPELYWYNKHNGHTVDSAGRVRVQDGVLVIDEIMPSDGGLYSCMAVSTTRNASRDVAIHTNPGPPHYLSVSPGPTSVLFSLKILPISGGTEITSFVLQWRQRETDQWEEVTVPASGPLAITALKPYTFYMVRLAALNAVGVGQFSNTNRVRTQGIREPDSPVLLSDNKKVKDSSFSVPLKQMDDGGVPLLHFIIRYKQDAEGAEWKEMQLPSDADSVTLKDLSYGSNYQLEVISVNSNGSSIPATFNFTIADQPVSHALSLPAVNHASSPPAVSHTSSPPAVSHASSPPAVSHSSSPPAVSHASSPPEVSHASSPPSVSHALSPPAVSHASSPPAVSHASSPPAVSHASSLPAVSHTSSLPAVGHASSPPAVSHTMPKGHVAGTVMLIFLVVILVVEATCCVLLIHILFPISVKLFGHWKVPGLKMLEGGVGMNNG